MDLIKIIHDVLSAIAPIFVLVLMMAARMGIAFVNAMPWYQKMGATFVVSIILSYIKIFTGVEIQSLDELLTQGAADGVVNGFIAMGTWHSLIKEPLKRMGRYTTPGNEKMSFAKKG